jgi:hypothetical protein
MRIGKYHPPVGQPVHIRGLHPWMTLQITCPIIKVVNDNEQNVGFILLTVAGICHQDKRQTKKGYWPVD